MKVFCIGYYDKFSRLFLGIKTESLAQNPSTGFRICSLYPSGFLYLWFRGTPSSCISFRAWFNTWVYRKRYNKIIAQQSTYKNLPLKKLIEYQLAQDKGISTKNLLLQAVSYIKLIDKQLNDFQPDVVLCIGDSRLPIDIVKALAGQRNIPVHFIEQGPYGTTVFDTKGVNANASIRQPQPEKAFSGGMEKIEGFINRPKRKKYSRSPFYRGIDYAIEFLLKNTPFYPPDLKIDNPLRKKVDLCGEKYKQQHFHLEKKYDKKLYLLVCQVPFDVNMTHHSPFYKDHFSILKDVHQNLPDESLLVVREHPIYRGKYEKAFYDYIKENRILIDCHKSVEIVFKNVDVVVVNNSTVGIEALAQKKPVVALGNSYYDSLCLKIDKKEELGKILAKALQSLPDEKRTAAFLNTFLFDYLIPGHIIDADLIAARHIAQKLLSNQKTKA